MLTLQEFFHKHPRTALGFSGGTDSAYLLYAGLHYGAEIRPYFVRTPFQPQFELDDALRLTEQLNTPLTIIDYDILKTPEVAANPADRCYYCKKALFERLKKQAAADHYPVLLDGTNASDEAGDRPGMRALDELSVLSPLRLCGLTKPEIRQLSRKAGLFTWDKPAYACLATRVPVGTPLDARLLTQIEEAEQCLGAMGFTDFRIRIFHGAARIQVTNAQFAHAVASREEIRSRLKPFFDTILLDTEARP